MLKKPEAQQQELDLVSIEALVPEGHLLRKMDGAVDFSFIRERAKHLYSEDNGRPARDPVVLFKLLLLEYPPPGSTAQSPPPTPVTERPTPSGSETLPDGASVRTSQSSGGDNQSRPHPVMFHSLGDAFGSMPRLRQCTA